MHLVTGLVASWLEVTSVDPILAVAQASGRWASWKGGVVKSLLTNFPTASGTPLDRASATDRGCAEGPRLR